MTFMIATLLVAVSFRAARSALSAHHDIRVTIPAKFEGHPRLAAHMAGRVREDRAFWIAVTALLAAVAAGISL